MILANIAKLFFGIEPPPEPSPRILEFEEKMKSMEPDKVMTRRFFNDIDRSQDRTVIVYSGMVDSRKLRDIELILKGTATAHLKPGKGVEA